MNDMQWKRLERARLEDAFWAHVPNSIEGYRGRINLLLELLTDDQLEEACDICSIEDDEIEEDYETDDDPLNL